jgi:hypothetical protein
MQMRGWGGRQRSIQELLRALPVRPVTAPIAFRVEGIEEGHQARAATAANINMAIYTRIWEYGYMKLCAWARAAGTFLQALSALFWGGYASHKVT